MKLLNCQRCHDIVKIRKGVRTCACGRSSAYYVDPRWVEYKGPARILMISNEEYARASPEQNYRWFVIPDGHDIRKIPNDVKPGATKPSSPEKGAPDGQTTIE